jgi:hypothetical protein
VNDPRAEDKAPRFWRRWWRFVVARIGVAAIVLLLLMPLLVLSLAPPGRRAEEPPQPLRRLNTNRLIIPYGLYDHLPRPEITPDDVTVGDCAPPIRVQRPDDTDREPPSRPAEQHCPGL